MSFYTNVSQLGNVIYLREVNDKGIRGSRVIKSFSPELFVKDPSGEYMDIFKTPLTKKVFKNIKECKAFISEYDSILSIYGMKRLEYQFISQNWPQAISYDPSKIRVMYIDIETLIGQEGFSTAIKAYTPITAITVYDSFHQETHCFTWCTDAQYQQIKATPVNVDKSVQFHFCRSEQGLLSEFMMYWKMNCPDIITGWNTTQFDIPYIYQRIVKVLDEETAKELSPFNWISVRKNEYKGKEEFSVDILGISQLDYLDLYKKFTYNAQESYKLDHIAHIELNENKIDFHHLGNLNDIYYQHYSLFLEYNIKDVMLVKRLDEKLKFFDIVFGVAYRAKVNYVDTLGVVKLWDIYLYNRLKEQNIVIPPEKRHRSSDQYEGAYVKDPIVGLHHWIVSFDAGSLYPSLIRQYNMSPETLNRDYSSVLLKHLGVVKPNIDQLINAEYDLSFLEKEGYCMAANGALFDKNVSGFLPPIVNEVLTSRKTIKKEMLKYKQLVENEVDAQKKIEYKNKVAALDAEQMAFKILANSLYGAVGNAYFRYYDVNIAEAITVSGQLCIRWLEKRLNTYLNTILKTSKDFVAAIDTDSVSGDAMIKTSIGDMTIENFWERSTGTIIERGEHHYIKHLTGISALGFHQFYTTFRPCHYIKKHLVEKEMFEIIGQDKQVKVTVDHSLIIFRNHHFISCSPKNIQSGDKLVILTASQGIDYVSEIIVRSLGVQQEWVYDLEIDGCHNFFANDILVHNSVICVFDDIVKLMHIPSDAPQKIVNALDKFCNERVNDYIDQTMVDLVKYTNAYDHTVFFKREKIAAQGLFLAKKRYILSVWNDEGVTYQAPKIKIVGIDLIKASVPEVCRKKAKELIPLILEEKEQEVKEAIQSFQEEFKQLPINTIAFPRTANGMTKYEGSHQKLYQKGTPMHVRAAILYNYLVKKLKLTQTYDLIKDGNKVRYVHLMVPNKLNENVIGFIDHFPEEFGLDTFVDVDEQFNKTFLQYFSSMTDVLNWKLMPSNETLEDFFM